MPSNTTVIMRRYSRSPLVGCVLMTFTTIAVGGLPYAVLLLLYIEYCYHFVYTYRKKFITRALSSRSFLAGLPTDLLLSSPRCKAVEGRP